MNTCEFRNFKIDPMYLIFDVVFTFSGVNPRTGEYVEYNNEIVPFHVEFSEPLEYDNIDVIQMLECYIQQAHLKKRFEEIHIDLDKKGKEHNFADGENYLLFNSYGFDSYSMYLAFRDELKEKMREFTWSREKGVVHYQKAIKNSFHYRTPVLFCFKEKMIEDNKWVLTNPCNATYLKFLLYKKFKIKLVLYGDTAFSYYRPEHVNTIYRLNTGFYQTELISLYISMILGDRSTFNEILFYQY